MFIKADVVFFFCLGLRGKKNIFDGRVKKMALNSDQLIALRQL